MSRNTFKTGLFETVGVCAVCFAAFGMVRLLPQWLNICLGALFNILVIISPKIASKHRIMLLRLRMRAFAFWWRVRHMLQGERCDLLPLNRALIQAVLTGNMHNVGVFLQRGADPNLRVDYDWPLLSRAAEAGYHEIATLLLNAGADVNAVNPSTRYTALMRAAKNGHRETVETLLQQGADLEAKNVAGTSALLGAVMTGQAAVVETLLKAYAEADCVPEQGRKAMAVARKHGYSEIAQLLQQADSEREIGAEKKSLLRPSIAP